MSEYTEFCGNCGKPKGEGFCPYCGHHNQLSQQKQQQMPQQASQQVQQQTPQQVSQMPQQATYQTPQQVSMPQQMSQKPQQMPQQPPMPQYYGQASKPKSKAWIALLISIIMLVVAAGVVYFTFFSDYFTENNDEGAKTEQRAEKKNKNNDREEDEEVEDDGDEDENKSSRKKEEKATDKPQPTIPPEPVFTMIEASSTRGADYTSGAEVNYYPSYAVDGDFATAWSSDRDIELTPSYTLRADTDQYVTGIKMTNGYCKNENTYTRNRRITKALIEYEGGSKTVTFGINEYRTMFDIRFDEPVETSYITVKVLETYYGDWKDIAISEIEVY